MTTLFSAPSIGPVPFDLIIKETVRTETGITSNPVESGAEVNDHAYIKPIKITFQIADRNVAATYEALRYLQELREPFDVITGLTVVDTCLIETMDFTRDKQNSNVLSGQVEIRQVIIAESNFSSNEDGTTYQNGEPGGKNSTTQAAPASSRSGDAATADRAAGTVNRSDNPATTVSPTEPNNASFLKNVLG